MISSTEAPVNRKALSSLLMFLFALVSLSAEQPTRLQHIRGGLSLLITPECNDVVLEGDDGLLLVDTPMKEFFKEAEAALSSLPHHRVRLVVNTHFHWDHTDGNPLYGSQGVAIIARPETRELLTKEHMFGTRRQAPSPAEGLPVVLVTSPTEFLFAGQRVVLLPFPGGHGSDDMALLFPDLKVIHLGDLLYPSPFPLTPKTLESYLVRFGKSFIDGQPPETIYLSSHDLPWSRQEIIDLHTSLSRLLRRAKQLRNSGVKGEKLLNKLLSFRESLPAPDRDGASSPTGWCRLLARLMGADRT